MDHEEFFKRRAKLLNAIGNDGAAILFAADECVRSGDVHYPFRQESDFFYFTGFNEPEAVAVLLPGRYILFNRAKDAKLERWLGPIAGQQGALEKFKADLSFDINLIDEKLTEFLVGRKNIYYPRGKKTRWDTAVLHWVSKLQTANEQKGFPGIQIADVRELSSNMRLIKSSEELKIIEKVAELSSAAHCAAMKTCRPGIYEFELEASLNYVLARNGCRFPAYPAIVGGGKNACILHYVENNSELRDGDLVLVDAGGELEGYAADITRTYPVNGKFTREQAAVYDLVLAAQMAVINAIEPGVSWNVLQEIAVKILSEGLVSLGIIKGSAKDVIRLKTYSDYYMHNIGHWLGLDVHDSGNYKIDDHWRILEPGMVFTVEPGLYLSPSKALNERWWNIGIRIEDDIVVTTSGCNVLTSGVPKERSEIEQLMASR